LKVIAMLDRPEALRLDEGRRRTPAAVAPAGAR
jgi:hypothetical protein